MPLNTTISPLFGTLYIKTEKKIPPENWERNYIYGKAAYDVESDKTTHSYTTKDFFLGGALANFYNKNKKLLSQIGIDDTLKIRFNIPVFNLSEDGSHREGRLDVLKSKRGDIYGETFPIMDTWGLETVGPDDPTSWHGKERKESKVRQPENEEAMVDVVLMKSIKGENRSELVRNRLTHTVEEKIAEELKAVMLHNPDYNLTAIEHQPTYQWDWRSWVKVHLGV